MKVLDRKGRRRLGMAVLATLLGVACLTGCGKGKGKNEDEKNGEAVMLPTVSFSDGQTQYNTLPGYVNEMHITSLRDTVTPTEGNALQVLVDDCGQNIEGINWEVLTLDGETVLSEGEEEGASFSIASMDMGERTEEEKVLKVTLHLEDEEVYYYTRLVEEEMTRATRCLQFAQKIQELEYQENRSDTLEKMLEPMEGKSGNLGHVTIHSNISQVQWAGLSPQIKGEVNWEIKESNETFTSLVARYQVTMKVGEDQPEHTYTVAEFFRVRVTDENQYLYDYDRKVDEVFEPGEQTISEKSVLFGITSEKPQVILNEEATSAAFVQNKALWVYEIEENTLAKIFDMTDTMATDLRDLKDCNEVKIVNVANSGNVVFTVLGYMPHGHHEGEVGVAVYNYNASEKRVEEKAFVPSKNGYYVMKEELGNLVYYSNGTGKLYVLLNHTLYEMDLSSKEETVLVPEMKEDQYVTSENGHWLAYQENDQTIQVLNMKSGESYQVLAPEGEQVLPVGFIRNDFICGRVKESDIGTIRPMYCLEIMNAEQKVLKHYENSGEYITDCTIEDYMMTIRRVQKVGNGYQEIDPDYITNNEAQQTSEYAVEVRKDELREQLWEMKFPNPIDVKGMKMLKPEEMLLDKAVILDLDEKESVENFYVYAEGVLANTYDRVSDAVQAADELHGVVVDAKQRYIWERGNRNSIYEVDNMNPFSVEDGQNSLEACLKYVLAFEGKSGSFGREPLTPSAAAQALGTYLGAQGLDLTGCTVNQVQYMIARETPVIAMIGTGHAVVLMGYTPEKIAYLDPEDGRRHAVSPSAMEEMVKEGKSVMIGYRK